MAKNKFEKNKINTLLSPENYIRNKARNLPFHECLINDDWQQTGLATILITKRQPSGNVVLGIYLTDTYCLGLKDTYCRFNLTVNQYENEYKEPSFNNQNFESCDYTLAHNIIYGAIEYAEDLGFRPHKDFTLSKFILNNDEEVEVLEELEFGKDGEPCFIAGPNDDVKLIIKKLNHSAGEGNYTVIHPNDEFTESDDLYDLEEDDYDEDGNEDEREVNQNVIKFTDQDGDHEYFLSEYDVTYEPLSAPNYEKYINEVGSSTIDELRDLCNKKPKQAIPIIKTLIAAHPKVPALYNFLAIAFEKSQMKEEALALVKETYEKFPDYLFGKINYCSFLIKDGKVEDAAEILDNKFEIKLQCPDRKVFHITEVTSFMVMATSYFIATDNMDIAESHFKALKSIDPKHSQLSRLNLEFAAARLKKLLHPIS